MSTMSSHERVRIRRDDAVAVVTIDNPPVNTLGNPVLEELLGTVRVIEADSAIRVLVVTGSGEKAFASGADLPEFAQMLGSAEEIAYHTSLTRRLFDGLSALRQPVIAAVQAAAVGGGLELALSCDLIVADERARLGVPEVGLGLIPGAGGTQRLPRRIGSARAAELVLRARLLKAPEAERIGLVTEAAPAGAALERALELASELASRPAVAVQAAKRAMRLGAELPLSGALDVEHDEFLATLASADVREGVDAFLTRRQPQFLHR
ncbi:MAG TPA: enoyl-CoA hydratase/isomerase family protein [Solirubrobacteraceae bacterium]|nr:enoyl-CoA hydratase/isomerase family protein [Solirubrobacteraceae bacterium]HTX13105.1 enoyl-CoA hydratase/isomerase family protein [Solirubrobacteraceae bacterium]